MKEGEKTKEKPIGELSKLRQRIAELEKIEIEHKSVEEKQKEFEKKYRKLLQTIPECVYRTTPDSEILYMSPAIEAIMGYSAEEFKKNKNLWIERIYKDDKKELFVKLERLIKKGISYDHEFRMTRKDGTIVWVRDHCNAILGKKGKLTGVTGMIFDITEHKRAEEAMRESEEKFRLIFNSASEGIVFLDTNGNILAANPAISKISGLEAEKIEGKNFVKLLLRVKMDVPFMLQTFKNMLQGKQVGKRDWGFINQKGEEVVALAHPALVKKEGKVVGLSVIVEDITKRKKAEEALLESKSKLRKQKLALEQKNIALREVIAQIEIEKKRIKENIENNIKMVASPILEKLKIRKDSHKYVNLLRHHLERLASQYSSKIASSNLKLTPREIEVCNMVKGGLTSKDISNLLNISCQTVDKHRENIRHKLGIHNKGVNLTSFLREL